MECDNVYLYEGQHSVTFTVNGVSKNTWDDWGLIPSSRHSEPANEIWSQKVTVGGVNGEEDLVRMYPYRAVNSYALLKSAIQNDNREGIYNASGYDIYKAVSGSLAFMIADQKTNFFRKRQEILNFLHNQQAEMVFADDPEKIFLVRASVDSIESGEQYSSVSISYSIIDET